MSIGAQLKQERLSQQRSLKEISALLKIAPRYLEAIERDDSDFFASKAYYLGYLKLYLKLLNLEHLMLPVKISKVPQSDVPPLQTEDKNSPTILQIILSVIFVILIYALY